MTKLAISTLALSLTLAGTARADEPRPVPPTRPEMKQLLEDMKSRKPRIPLPELTEAEKAQLGERASGYEARLRALYLPPGDGFGFGGNRPANPNPNPNPGANANPAPNPGRNSDPSMTLDYAFKTEMFWIASRANNCQYCLGHQESKLLAAGVDEGTIAALDGDWSEFNPAQRAAFAYARTLTAEPDRLADADVDALRPYYKDLQILEMTLSVAGNNAINRWKEGAGIPQSKDGGNFGRTGSTAPQTYLTPTPEEFRARISKVAPVRLDPSTGEPTRRTTFERRPLETRAEAERAFESARTRKARLPVLDEAKARSVVSESWPEGPLPRWVRLVANFPREGANRIAAVRSGDEKGDLSPLLKARVAWIVARQDRAWYAADLARRKLKALGQTDDQIFALDGDWSGFSEADRAPFTLARKLGASPVVLTDSDVEAAVKLVGPRDVTQLIHFITTRAWLDRVTEAAGLPLEE